MQDFLIRHRCLELAIQAPVATTDTEDIVKRAKAFEAYLNKKDEPPTVAEVMAKDK